MQAKLYKLRPLGKQTQKNSHRLYECRVWILEAPFCKISQIYNLMLLTWIPYYQVHRFSSHSRHEYIPPLLKVQIWDKDRITRSDFIGKTVLYTPISVKIQSSVCLIRFQTKAKLANLWTRQRWFICVTKHIPKGTKALYSLYTLHKKQRDSIVNTRTEK